MDGKDLSFPKWVVGVGKLLGDGLAHEWERGRGQRVG